MRIQQRLHDLAQALRELPYRNGQDPFTRLSPTLDGLDRPQLIDARAGAAIADENDDLEPAAKRQQLIADRARQAQAIATQRQHTLGAVKEREQRHELQAGRLGVER
jgi:hypothetical protein